MTISIDFDEKDIEDYLCTDGNLFKHLDLKLIARQVKIFDFYIDILAYSKLEKCFYIIELKKNDLNAKAYAQVKKYKRLLEIKYFKKHNFKTLLIGQNLAEELFFLVENYQRSKDEYLENINDYYALFNYDFESGISFAWFNKQQRITSDYLKGYVYGTGI